MARWVRTMVNTSGSMTPDLAAGLFTCGDLGSLARHGKPDICNTDQACFTTLTPILVAA